MGVAVMSWVRLWHGMPTDPKWRTIARKSGQPLPCVIAVFNLMMVNASSNTDERGSLHNWDDEDAAAALDMEAADVTAILAAMQGKVLDGKALTGWNKRQPKREDANAASRKREQRSRETAENKDVSRTVTHCHAPDTDTDTDIIRANALVDLPIDDTPQNDELKPEHVVEAWNDMADRQGLPKVQRLTPKRRASLKTRLREYPQVEDWTEAIGAIERSQFLRGGSGSGWRANFDFLLQPSSFIKLIEGAYDNVTH